MMKLPKLKRISIALALVLFITGCYWNTPVIELISPPRLTNEQIEIYNALTNAKGSALNLKYPKTGEFLSAFVFKENPSAEASVMVFYELTGTASELTPTIWLTFLEKDDVSRQWKCTDDISFFASSCNTFNVLVLRIRF
jgi:hypothetical protein